MSKPELPEPIRRIELYFNDKREPVKEAKDATFKYVTLFDDNGEITEQYSVIIVDGIDPELEEATEEFKEDEHSRDEGGKFTAGAGSKKKVDDFVSKLTKDIQPKQKEVENLKEVDEEITNKVKDVIKKLGYEDKINFVEMQGSYAKGTNLTGSSDLDLFVGFDKSVSDEDFKRIGLEIGMKALDGYNPVDRSASHKYAEAYIDKDGQQVEVQVVPAFDVSLDDIKNGEMRSATDRTPHQTRFMNQALKGKETEVRLLKSFLKRNNVYDSSMKVQGFSGYSTEVLIHNFGSFKNTLEFFANFEKGKVVGDASEKFSTPFTLMDPIDPKRNLVSAFSDEKIGRLIKVSQHFLEHGEEPKPTKTEEESLTLSFNTSQLKDEILHGELRRSMKALTKQIGLNGFDIKNTNEKITEDFDVDVTRHKVEVDGDKVSISFGLEDFTASEFKKKRGPPVTMTANVKAFRDANAGNRIEKEGDHLIAYAKRPHRGAKAFLKNTLEDNMRQIGISKELIDDLSNGFDVKTGKKTYENLV